MIYKFIFKTVWHCQQHCINDNLNSSFIVGFFFFIVNSFPVHRIGQRLVKIKKKTTATNHQRKRKWDPLQSVKATQYASIGQLQVQFSVAGRCHCSWCRLNENKFDLDQVKCEENSSYRVSWAFFFLHNPYVCYR